MIASCFSMVTIINQPSSKMITRNLSPQEYRATFPSPRSAYSSVDFALLNRHKAEAVSFTAVYDSASLQPVAGIIAGLRSGVWLAPFSAPFATIDFNTPVNIGDALDVISELSDHFGPGELRITLEPEFYTSLSLSHLRLAATNLATRNIAEYNYHYPLDKIDSYNDTLTPAARRNLAKALRSGLSFTQVSSPARPYPLIKAHYAAKGYTLHLGSDEIEATAEIVPTDYFVVTDPDGNDIAGAVIHTPAQGVAQLIYWSDKEGAGGMRPMNFLAYSLCSHYARRGYRIFDFGPASTGGIPASGLCRFKESVGCQLTAKPIFVF